MDPDLKYDLICCETDIDGALSRFADDEALYVTCLAAFLDDPTMGQIKKALEEENWDDAYTTVHALKGLAGNMGFIPLFHAAAELVILIRKGNTLEIPASYKELRRCYRHITSTIHRHCAVTREGA